MQVQVKMVVERETKGTFLFKEVDANGVKIESMYDAKIGSMYIRKDALNGARPKTAIVTVEVS